jgi:hypothetical protein
MSVQGPHLRALICTEHFCLDIAEFPDKTVQAAWASEPACICIAPTVIPKQIWVGHCPPLDRVVVLVLKVKKVELSDLATQGNSGQLKKDASSSMYINSSASTAMTKCNISMLSMPLMVGGSITSE